MNVINEKLTSAIHTALDNISHDVRITIVQPKNEHNIPWHYINKEYLFKVEVVKSEWPLQYTEEQEALMDEAFKTRYATTPAHLSSIVRAALCFSLGCNLLEDDTVKRFEEETGEAVELPCCHEDEDNMVEGYALIANVQMLDWHFENERKANDPFWGQDDLVEVNTPW